MVSKEIIDKYNIGVTIEELKQSLGDTPDTELRFYRSVLIQTDHVPLKIYEDFIETMTSGSVNIGSMIKFFKEVKTEYADVLEARKTARAEINRIESELAAGA